MVSFMRLMHRRNVDLPQPDGPISAVIFALLDVHAHALERDPRPVAHAQSAHDDPGHGQPNLPVT